MENPSPAQGRHPIPLDLEREFLVAKRAAVKAERRSVQRPPSPSPPPNQVPRTTTQAKGRTLWQDDSTSLPLQRPTPTTQSLQSGSPAPSPPAPPTSPPRQDAHVLIKQPETKPISQEHLIAEVKGIYAGLVMVESKCIEVDNAQSNTDPSAKLTNEQWQALIALHRTLLHEHHDFFLAIEHRAVSPALRRLASKYAMPARMWRHGIHSFLELLRHRLSAAYEHMLTFIHLANSMMALLYETVPAVEDTWIECLGDLSRYRMAIEDEDMTDREVWTSVSRHWYSKASDKAPTTGRLYHLAILARPNALQQLFYYTKALSVAIPFLSARESILTLFDPLLRCPTDHVTKLDPWREMALLQSESRFQSAEFPMDGLASRPLLEDYALCGLLWTENYFPPNWFSNDDFDDIDKWFGMPSLDGRRGNKPFAFSPGQLAKPLNSMRTSSLRALDGLPGLGECLTFDRMLTFFAIGAAVSVPLRFCAEDKCPLEMHEAMDVAYARDQGRPSPMALVEGVAIFVAILFIVLLRAYNDWQKDQQFAKLHTKTPADDVFTQHQDARRHTSVSRSIHLLKNHKSKMRTLRNLIFGLFLTTHGIPLVAAALTLHPGFRIASGVTASVSGVTVIPLRTNGGFPAWSWILTYGVWVGAFAAYLCLQTLRLPSEPSRRRPLYLFLVIMAGLHLTIAISQGSESIPDALTMYGPVLLTASAFLMALFLRAIHPGGPNAGAGAQSSVAPDEAALTLGVASLGFGL